MQVEAKRNLPRRAVVLAAGLGTRLRPLTLSTPKPLLPVWGEPMLERILQMLESWGVEEIAVNAHHLAGKIDAYCRNRKGTASIRVSTEKDILGTGGALNPLRGFLGEEPFWLVNGDIVIEDLPPEPIAEAFRRSGGLAGCWIREEGPRTVEADPEGRICNWRSDDAGAPGTYTYCGCAMLGPEILGYVAPEGFSTIVDAYEKAMADSRFAVGAVVNDAFWWDAGTPERLAEVNGGTQPAALFGDKGLDKAVEALAWDDAGAEFLGARGSDRAFWRIDRANGDTAIAISYDDEKRPENARYAACAALLDSAGVPVPRVLADMPGGKMLVIEDIGGGSLEEKAADAKGKTLVSLYAPVAEALRKMHDEGTRRALESGIALEPAFGPDLYAWERNLFEEHCLKARYAMDKGIPPDVREELEGVAAEFRTMPAVLVHRDFQSSNILYRKDGSFAFIDFQGMRLGPAAYDLASLLYDPYSPNLTAKEREAITAAYGGMAKRELALGAVQRLVQALGAFGRLASVGHPRFSAYIPRALGNLLEAADDAGLDATGALAEDLIAKEEIRLRGWPGHVHVHGDGDGDENEEGAS